MGVYKMHAPHLKPQVIARIYNKFLCFCSNTNDQPETFTTLHSPLYENLELLWSTINRTKNNMSSLFFRKQATIIFVKSMSLEFCINLFSLILFDKLSGVQQIERTTYHFLLAD